MPVIVLIYIFTLIGSIFSLIGGVILIAKEKFAFKVSHLVSAFAAGTLLGTSFFELLPEASHHLHEHGNSSEETVFIAALAGILLFFLLQKFISWFHHSHTKIEDEEKQSAPLIVIGDTVHNFIDGMVIAATFLINVPLGIATTIAVAAHEIPQEIGDFGILLKKGIRARNVIMINVLSALAAVLGATIVIFVGDYVEEFLPYLLAVTAGFFIYIALADLIPGIHHNGHKKSAYIESSLVIAGVGVMWIVSQILSH